MNIIESLMEKRTRVIAYASALDKVLELYHSEGPPMDPARPVNLPPSLETLSSAPEAGLASPGGNGSVTPPPARERTPAPRGNGQQEDRGRGLKYRIGEALAAMDPPFTAAGVAATLGEPMKRISDALALMVRDGVLTRLAPGQFARLQARPAKVRPPRSQGRDAFRQPRGRQENSVAAVVRAVAATIAEPFTISTLLPLVKADPRLAGKKDELVNMSAAKALLTLRSEGWLQRAGEGRPTPYTRSRKFLAATTRQATMADLQAAIQAEVDPQIAARREAAE